MYCVQTAVVRRIRHGRIEDKQHWLQYAVPKYTVSTCHVIIIYNMSCDCDVFTAPVYGRCETVPTSGRDAPPTPDILGTVRSAGEGP